MAQEKVSLKRGMGGSRCGKGRTAKTNIYKQASKKLRRQDDKKACNEHTKR